MKNALLHEQRQIEKMEKSYIFPHEFLYLVCNSQNRIEIIE